MSIFILPFNINSTNYRTHFSLSKISINSINTFIDFSAFIMSVVWVTKSATSNNNS